MFFRRPRDQIELGTTRSTRLFHKRIAWSRLHIGEEERRTHTYVVGITGTGKSKLLEHILFQDIVHGRGCGVLDPHSDLIRDLLRYLRTHSRRAHPHWERIIYFDPARRDYLLPFNVLKSGFPPYETAQNVVDAFRRTWPRALAEAPRFTNIATAAILTLIANELTLVEMPRLLTDKAFRARLLEQVQDEELRAFWHDRYEKWGRETPLMIESVLNKVTAFTFNPQLRLILGAGDNRLDFRRLMDAGKVLLVDLGRCDAETRRLVGSLVVTGLEQAARARRDRGGERAPFYFCIDEFQDFCLNEGAAQTLAQLLSECRKFGLHLTLAHQTLAQIGERMKGALGNIQLKLAFAVARQDAEILAKHLFEVSGEKVKFKLKDGATGAPGRPIFYTVQEEWERAIQALQKLEPRTAYVRRPNRDEVIRLQTTTIKHGETEDVEMAGVRGRLALKSGVAVPTLAAAIRARHTASPEEAPRLLTRERTRAGLEAA